MEDRFDRLESTVIALCDQMAAGFGALNERLDGLRVDFGSLRDETHQGDANTRSQLGTQVDSLRGDIRIFAEAHISLEKRVTALERRPR